jgi:hypothetical protein
MVMLLVLRQAHSRRIPQKQSKNKKKKNVMSESEEQANAKRLLING